MRKLRLIFAGVGGMGVAWRNNALLESPDFDVVALVDILDKPLEEAGPALNVPRERWFKSLETAIDATEADAVLTVTPPAVHVEHARLAFARGLHVLTEKPIADSLENARRMVRWARDAGRQLSIAQNYRYTNENLVFAELMRSKPVGDLGHGHLDFYIAADFTGTFRQTMEFPLLVDMAIHHLDLIRAVTGRNIVKVTAISFNPAWSWYVHDSGLKMLLELEGGIPFSYSGDWSGRGRQTGWSGSWRLQCAEGSIHLDGDAVSIERCERWGKNPTRQALDIPQLPREQVGQARLLRDFAAAIRANHPSPTSGEDNLWSFAAVMAGVMSAPLRRSIDVGALITD
jgi:predicted dehydrogenase